MKIYFGFTVAGDRSTVETARRIVQVLEEMGHEVLTRHLVSDNAWEADRKIGPQDVYRRDMAWLQECEVLVAEVSGSSFGLGFETGYLLGATTKKVILLYRLDLAKTISLLITGNTLGMPWLLPGGEWIGGVRLTIHEPPTALRIPSTWDVRIRHLPTILGAPS